MTRRSRLKIYLNKGFGKEGQSKFARIMVLHDFTKKSKCNKYNSTEYTVMILVQSEQLKAAAPPAP